ncbi:NAD(P)-dependent alcohol dehydrogenase [Pseudomonas sp. USTB-Z]|uniref:NAD(P)-dependent alcohol dehydrogenase n=1 Tax=Pseudomonas sp. USTB-Z TaxID=2794351 RepID=UPI001C83AFF2|nr:NAD(P)-dependent alcohol dehydrogenase [Pseudomonas sp. USTB-Z]MBX6689186.1 NAD(P)-dependent alcohol dehydrogenase [Pseudomonas sp. USTB-Z]
MQIKAAVVRDTSAPFVVETLTLDEPRADEILVRVVGAGVCHTDMVVRDQGYPVPLPLVLGHEGSGVVERVGANVKTLQPGDHVVLSYANCGHCSNCLCGAPGYCESFYDQNFGGQRTDGSTPYKDVEGHAVCGCFFNQSSFGTHALVSERNAIKIPKDVPLELMGPLGCGIQTGAGAIMNALEPGVGSSIAVFGTGSVGLSAIMAAKAVGCTQIIAVDMNDARLELAKELGATHVINPASTNTLDKIREISGGGVQFSLECTSHPKVLRQAVDCLRIPGVCGLVGAAPLGTEVSLDMNTVLFGRTLRGIIEGDSVPKVFIPQLIELWRAGRFPFDRLVKYYALEEINQAVADSESGVVLKPILKP